LKHVFGAAVLGCGLVVCGACAQSPAPAAAAREAVPAATMQRLLLLDAERAGSRIVAVGDRGAIVYSDDQGKTWLRARSPAAPLLTALDFLDDQLGLAVGHDAVILLSRDRGETWEQVFSAPSEQRPLLDVLFLDRDHAIAVGAYGAYYESSDGGRGWKARKVLPDDRHLNAIVEVGDKHLVLLGEAGTILISGDAGASWRPVPSPYKGSFFGGVVAEDGAVVAFGLRGRIFRSTDKGATWSPVDNPSVAALMGGDKLPDGALVIAGAAGRALVSRDGGRSFVPVATGTSRALAKPVLGGPDEVLLLGEAGVRAVPLPSARRHSPQ
jgi:photosystem II stability/assembly factor-like uncharacterized protein